MNYKELAQRLNCTLNLLEILQMSSEARQAWKETGLPIRKPKAKKDKGKGPAQEDPHTRTASPSTQPPPQDNNERSSQQALELNHHVEHGQASLSSITRLGPRVHADEGAFKCPVTFRVKYHRKSTKVIMPLGMSHANQGSDLNLTTESLWKIMGFRVTYLTDWGWRASRWTPLTKTNRPSLHIRPLRLA